MGIKNILGGSSTNSLGVITTMTAVAFVGVLEPQPLIDKPLYSDRHSVIFKSIESTGGDYTNHDSQSFVKVSLFANRFIQEQMDIPAEFDKIFKDNFWDLLA